MREYKLNVYNTLTGKYENITVDEETFHIYQRMGWNQKDRNKSFYDHEIQFSCLSGNDEGECENFHEWMNLEGTPEKQVEQRMLISTLRRALLILHPQETALIRAIYFQQKTEREYADEIGLAPMTVHDRKVRILKKLKEFLDFEK